MAYQQPPSINLVIDIETVTHPVTQADIIEYMRDYKPPANYKNEEVIAKHRAETERNAINDISDSRRFSLGGKRMVSLAAGLASMKHGVTNITSWASDDLSEIVLGFIEYVNSIGPYNMVGWNIKGFDLPEIVKSIHLTGNSGKLAYKPGKWNIIDLCDYPFKRTKLKETAKAFGIETLGLDGSCVADLHAAQNWAAIQKYNEDDVRITGEIFIAASNLYSF